MTEEKATIIGGIITFLMIVIPVYFFGWAMGDINGWDRAIEHQKKWDCEWNNSNKAYKDVEAKCLKYFEQK